MSETKHTPGPWLNAGRSAGAHIHADDGEIAWLRSYMGISNEQIEANARLIASAPDLLDALKGAEAIMAQNIYPKPDVGPEHPWSVLQSVRAAISKAEGSLT